MRGIETVDACMGDIRPAVAAAGGLLCVTADHGNSEVMIEPDGSPNTAHTTNPVPLWIDRPGLPLREGGSLGDVAPTLCALMGWDPPPAMTGRRARVAVARWRRADAGGSWPRPARACAWWPTNTRCPHDPVPRLRRWRWPRPSDWTRAGC